MIEKYIFKIKKIAVVVDGSLTKVLKHVFKHFLLHKFFLPLQSLLFDEAEEMKGNFLLSF